MKAYIIIFLFGIIIFVLWKYSDIREVFDPIQQLSLYEMNERFHTDIVDLPKNIVVIGVEDNKIYTFNYLDIKDKDELEGMNPVAFLHYWYNNIHPFLTSSKYYFLLCFSDGYREHIPHCEELIPFIATKNQFSNKFELGDISTCSQPILHKHKYVFTYSKQTSDNTAICIPDRRYINRNGYTDNLHLIDTNQIPFGERKAECIFRGTIENGSKFNFKEYENKSELNQRKYLKKIQHKISNFDFKDDYKDIVEQIKYKYILDVDGWSNTWDATVWKLYSGSVLLKTDSIWEQWYYDKLHPWVHYVPVENDFSDLDEKIKWCILHDTECQTIVKNSREFVFKQLNWERVKKDTIGIFQKYIDECFPSNL
jgi:hypothetical protein